ncbi:Rrf2 family transcriptional regulator [uncultured Methylovirgula sp.]|uniref:RrF2 family transcriptional regulator n=1 Tax=uncultured Methylovirgula sp. TaxID=1285960 RepID=UPI002606ADC3|nr:Rrf2 family transcriptional regulator [uncultured Methylovirgula sp.]
MILLDRRSVLALAAVVDIAIHARPQPVAAKLLAARLDLPPRHLETLLQALVRAEILKGVRGPRGGYELARERRRITAAEVVSAIKSDGEEDAPRNAFVENVIQPVITKAGKAFLADLEGVTIDDICRQAAETKTVHDEAAKPDFTI